jgi:hypothetical protein
METFFTRVCQHAREQLVLCLSNDCTITGL